MQAFLNFNVSYGFGSIFGTRSSYTRKWDDIAWTQSQLDSNKYLYANDVVDDKQIEQSF